MKNLENEDIFQICLVAAINFVLIYFWGDVWGGFFWYMLGVQGFCLFVAICLFKINQAQSAQSEEVTKEQGRDIRNQVFDDRETEVEVRRYDHKTGKSRHWSETRRYKK